MDAEQFRLSAEDALNHLPEKFRLAMENVVIVTEDVAEPAVLQHMCADSPYELLGLYVGRPVTEREAVDSGALPDMIYLYRQPILAESRRRGERPEACIAAVLMHEIGHYFGFSDADMEQIERQPAPGEQR